MSHAQNQIENYYSQLISIALKIVKCKEDAEDIVQDVCYKWIKQDQDHVQNIKAYLIRAVKNACFNFLNEMQNRKVEALEDLNQKIEYYQHYIGNSYIDFEAELSKCFTKMMKQLTPKEQAVYVLKNSFNCSYEDITDLIGTRVENARKIYQRAKERMQKQEERFEINKQHYQKKFKTFLNAHKQDDLYAYINDLKQDLSQWVEEKQASFLKK